MRVEFLGTAGYHPSETRHTTGVFVPDAAPDDAFLLDGGSGTFRLIGRDLPARLNVFMSHAHLDHTFGLTFLYNIAAMQRIMRERDLEIIFHGDAKTCDAVCGSLFNPLVFPLPFQWQWHEIEAAKPFEVAGVRVNTALLPHPGGSLGYRFDWENRSLGFVTDTSGTADYFSLIEGVDTLIHERNFPNEFAELALQSGHCTSRDLVGAGRASGARQIAAMHFNPITLTDPLQEDDVYAQLPDVIAAVDGLTLEI